MITTLLDIPITIFIQSFRNNTFAWWMEFISRWGEPERFIFIIALTCAFFLIWGYIKHFKYLLTTTIFTGIFGSIMKMIVNRTRPSSNLVQVYTYTNEASFPSNHVLVFTVFFGLLIYFTHKSKLNYLLKLVLKSIFTILIVSVGISRVYLGAHWFTDCLAGYLIGLAVLYYVINLYQNGKR